MKASPSLRLLASSGTRRVTTLRRPLTRSSEGGCSCSPTWWKPEAAPPLSTIWPPSALKMAANSAGSPPCSTECCAACAPPAAARFSASVTVWKAAAPRSSADEASPSQIQMAFSSGAPGRLGAVVESTT